MIVPSCGDLFWIDGDMGRPLKEIDGEQVFKLARLGCTQEEIGEFFACDHRTVGRRFAQEYELGKAAGKTSIRRWQMKKGRAGCSTMLIHLGKQYLGQTDRLDIKTDGKALTYIDRANNPRDRALALTNGDGQHTNGNGLAP